MTNETTLHVSGALSPGQPVLTQGAACGLADIENPTDAPLQFQMQLVLSCGDGADAQVFAQPCDIEIPAQSIVSLGLGLTCGEESSLGLGPAGGESSGSVFRPVMNEATELADLNATLIARGAETVDPEALRWSADPEIVNVQLPSGEIMRIGLSLGSPTSDREPWVADPVPDFDPDEDLWGPEAPRPADTGDLLVTWDASPWRALEVESTDSSGDREDVETRFTGGGDTAGDESDNPDAEIRPPRRRRRDPDTGDDGMEPLRARRFPKAAISVTVDVGVDTTLTVRSRDDLIAVPRTAEPETWAVIEAGTSSSVDTPSEATFTFSWPSVSPATALRAMRNASLSDNEPGPRASPYEQPIVQRGGRQFRSSIPDAEDGPTGRSSGQVRRNRSSIPRGEDGPTGRSSGRARRNRSSIPGRDDGPIVSRGTSAGLLGVPPLRLALAVGGLALVAFIAFALLGGGDGDSAPASEATTAVGTGGTGAAAGGSGVGAAQSSPTGVIAGRPVEEQLQLLAEMFQAAAAATLRRGEIAIGEDGRRADGASPVDWDAETSVFVGTDEDSDELYILVQGPSEVVGGTCGEVDLLVNGEHTGDGVDFCAAGATAPGHLSDLIRYEFTADGEWAAVMIATGLPVPAQGEVAVWQYQTEASGAYEAVERFIVATEVPWLPIVKTAGTSDGAIAANVSGPPPPQLAVPSIGGVLGTSSGSDPTPQASVFAGVIAPGSYAVTFHGIRDGTCGQQPEYTTNMLLQVGISPADDGLHDITFFDGQTRATGVIDVTTGQFEAVGGQYSGTLFGDFSTSQVIIRTLELPACTAKYFISVTAQ